MPRISRFRLSADHIDQLSQKLVSAISSLRDTEALLMFFDDLLTRTEKIMLGKRLLIAILLEKGYSYGKICSIVKVSQATISGISERLGRSGRGLRLAIANLDKKEKTEKWMEPVLNFLSGMAKPLTSKTSIGYRKWANRR